MTKIAQIGLLCLFGISSVSAAGNYGGSWRWNVDVFGSSDDNINRAEADRDRLDDNVLGAVANVSYVHGFTRDRALVYSLELQHESYDSWDRLSNTAARAGAEYRFRARSGFTAPVYSLSVTIGSSDYDSQLRDSTEASITASMFKQMTDRVSLTTGLAASDQDADSDIFDIARTRLFAVGDYKLTRKVSMYLRYQYIDGDIVSSALPTGKIVGARRHWKAWGADDAFPIANDGGHSDNWSWWTSTYSPGYRTAYRLEAATQTLELGCSIALSGAQALQLAVESYDSDADGGIAYEGMRVRADYLIRF